MSSARPIDRRVFEIAIICTLRIESDAVEATFDEFLEEGDQPHYGKVEGDPNSYTLGKIGQHYVVLAYMSNMGKVSSASVAASFRASFPNIRLGLVVGICGGVPQPTHERVEIFLGDVIISTGVVQFDLGRQFADKVIRRDTLEDNLGRPNSEIRRFLHQVQGWRGRTKLQKSISTSIAQICSMDGFDDWTCPPLKEDKLYQANYYHKHHDPTACAVCAKGTGEDGAACNSALTLSCEQLQCDESQLISRKRKHGLSLASDCANPSSGISAPAIHFGRIGSSDLVMKSSLHRDRIATQEKLLGYEMEGAGVWDNFPTIVVKGVCDYADSHKNKKWQKFASVTAAACAKALLLYLDKSMDEYQRRSALDSSSDERVTFNNYGKVGNQAVNQTFYGSVTF
ncbi:nucleoside phosphorylase domain-containing protein [Xylogone sp. PMI_703]|nr:nucleoside phosphorylase domain-containing protein [Xylogone sp. PMI_703]